MTIIKVFGEDARQIAKNVDDIGATQEAESESGALLTAKVHIKYVEGRTVVSIEV